MDSKQHDDSMTILVVDDDQPIRQLVGAILNREGYRVLTAGDGAAALNTLAKHPEINLILLDWMMPVMNGLKMLDELSQQDNAPPVLMLSARTQQKDVLEALQAGATDYILKPLQKDMLVAKVNNILEQHRQSARLRAARRKAVNLGAATPFTIIAVSESGICLESSFALEPGSVLFLESEEMSLKLDQPLTQRYAIRILRSEGKGNKHKIYGEFAGLTPPVQLKFQQVTRAGGWLR